MKRLIYVLLVLCLCISSCGSETAVSVKDAPDFAAPLERALNALLEGDGEDYYKEFPPRMVKDYKEQEVCLYYYSLQDMSAWLKNNLRIYGDSYGEDFYIRGSISRIEMASVAAMGDANLDYHTYMRYVTEENTAEVMAAYFNYTIGGSEGSEEKEAKLYFVKQEEKWYLHPCFAFYTF